MRVAIHSLLAVDSTTIHCVELDRHTTEECEDRGPALAKVHSSCKEKHFEYSVASVDAWISFVISLGPSKIHAQAYRGRRALPTVHSGVSAAYKA